jgi:hypothetical protein
MAVDVCLTFKLSSSFFLNVFLFPPCTGKLLGDWYVNRRGAPNKIILLRIQYLWRTDAPCSTCISSPNKQINSRNIIGKLKANRIRSALPIRAGNTSLLFFEFLIFYFEVNIPSKSNKQNNYFRLAS